MQVSANFGTMIPSGSYRWVIQDENPRRISHVYVPYRRFAACNRHGVVSLCAVEPRSNRADEWRLD